MKTDSENVELLAPAGSFDVALAAFAAGADAVYLGLDAFSARASAVNLSADELRRLLAYARAQTPPKRVYVTFNVVVDDAQLADAIEKLALLDELRPDALIVQDLGVARLVRRHFPDLALHASTQMAAHNLEGVLALKELGFSRVVLARELSLDDVRTIAKRSGVEIETFVHGALCYSISGLCLFSAMERRRSGNRGQCAYCCRLPYSDAAGKGGLPFSMRDLRLDDSLDALKDAGVVSLKIEGRMKSALYVASVVKRYRELLDASRAATTRADLETVFSRRTTSLYLHGYGAADVIDPTSLGHLGTPIGVVKRITRDRENRAWLRFHTSRALERHDGLQFAPADGGDGSRPAGLGISEMRLAISRRPVFEAPAGSDVEILLPPDACSDEQPSNHSNTQTLKHSNTQTLEHSNTRISPGMTVYCSASNEVKRRFPVPSFRPADYPAGTPVDIAVALAADRFVASVPAWDAVAEISVSVAAAQHPEKTDAAVRRAFAKLGETDWSLGALTLSDPDKLFAPASALNDLRRALVEKLDSARAARRAAKIAECANEKSQTLEHSNTPLRVAKLRLGQSVPDGEWDEIVVAIGHSGEVPQFDVLNAECLVHSDDSDNNVSNTKHQALSTTHQVFRLALPAFTKEADFGRLRARVKGLLRNGYTKWEAADWAGLRMLRQLGVEDVTADWTLYAFNRHAMAALAALGVRRFVCSPENEHANLVDLARAAAEDPSLPRPEFLVRQSTPLFISLTRPAADDPSTLSGVRGDEFRSFPLDGLWITTRPEPRRFAVPAGTVRTDISWDAPEDAVD